MNITETPGRLAHTVRAGRWPSALLLAAVCVVLGAWLLVARPGIGSAPGSLVCDTGATELQLYNTWVDQMDILASFARPPYASDRYDRLRQVAQLQAQNERAAGMVLVLTPSAPVQSSPLTRLAEGLGGINQAINSMLLRMETGYTEQASSQVAPRDIDFIRRLIVQRILRGLPRNTSSASAVESVTPRLISTASELNSLASRRFSEPPPTPTSGAPYP
jgi:hypothetical protein